LKGKILAVSFALLALIAVVAQQTEAWNVINVPAGGDLQHALDIAKPGDSIRLQPGATYKGNFILRKRGGTMALPIIIRSSADTGAFPTGRISPAYASLMPKLKSPNNEPVLQTEPGVQANGYLLKFLEVVSNENQYHLIRFGQNDETQTSLAQVPKDLEIDRCYIHGTSTSSTKLGLALDSGNAYVHDSYFSNFHIVGNDAQAIAGVNGPGPYRVENNYLEAAGENIIFGGDDPKIPNLVPQNITIRYNRITKPMSWKGGNWQIKNLVEVKNAQYVLVEANVIENTWLAAQQGTAVVFTPRNQNGTAPWVRVRDVTFQYNIIRNVGSGIVVLAYDDEHVSQVTKRITIRQNLITTNSAALGGDGRFILLDWGRTGGAYDIVLDHNTANNDGTSAIYFGGQGTWPGFIATNNLARAGAYGLMSEAGIGTPTMRKYFPTGTFQRNGLGGASASEMPTGNDYPSLSLYKQQFVNFAGADYRLTSSSQFLRAGTDGANMGADVAAVLSKTAGR
jgi:hypothetical protein